MWLLLSYTSSLWAGPGRSSDELCLLLLLLNEYFPPNQSAFGGPGAFPFLSGLHLIWKIVDVLVPSASATLFPTFFFSLKRLLLFSLSPVHSNTSEQIATSHIFKFKFFLPLFLQEVVLENSVPWLSLVPAVVFPLSGAPCSPDISYSPSTGPKSSLLLGFPSSSTNAFTAGSQFLTRVWGSVLLLRLIRCNHRSL